MPVARPETSDARVIAHIDMDCFYVQVEQRKQPDLRGQPTAVVQYNSWKGGGLIAVSYEARKYGVKRSMRGDDAKHVCPQIQLVQVPVARGKADLSIYRNAGSEVVSILARKGRCERASIDEVYLDLTDAVEAMLAETPPESLETIHEEALKSHVLGLNEDGNDVKEIVWQWICRNDADHRDKLLACGAIIVAELRLQVLKETEFTCSAGIAHNKMLAKLASGMNKPAQQTVVPFSSVMGLLKPLPIKKMKQLGGKLGSSLEVNLGVNTVGDLLMFSKEKLQEHYGTNTGTWLWNIARGISGEEVESRLLPKSHGSGKTFPGPKALKMIASVFQSPCLVYAVLLCISSQCFCAPIVRFRFNNHQNDCINTINIVATFANIAFFNLKVEHWLNELCEELSERLNSDLDENKRIAHTLTLHARAYKCSDSDSHKKFPSKSCPLRYGTAKIQEDALNLFQAGLREYLGSYRVKTQGSQNNGWGITALSVTASKIVATPSGTGSIMKYFHGQDQSHFSSKQSNDIFIEGVPSSSLGSGSYSGLKLTESKIDLGGEKTRINYAVPILDQQEHKRRMWKEQDTCLLVRSADSQDPSHSSKQVQGGITQETSSVSSSGTESCLLPNQNEAQMEFPGEETRMKYAMQSVKPQEQKRKILKQKGTSSILRFFQSRNSCSFSKLEHFKNDPEAEASSFSGESCDEGLKDQLPQETPLAKLGTNSGTYNLGQDEKRRDSWRYKMDEIDPMVVNELPPEIQEELWGWLRPHKRVNIAKRGSSIAHYFSPAKSS